MEGGGNEFNTYIGCPCDSKLNINFSLFIFYEILFILVFEGLL